MEIKKRKIPTRKQKTIKTRRNGVGPPPEGGGVVIDPKVTRSKG